MQKGTILGAAFVAYAAIVAAGSPARGGESASSLAERAATAELNRDIATKNDAADERYVSSKNVYEQAKEKHDAQQQQYEAQQQQYQANLQDYELKQEQYQQKKTVNDLLQQQYRINLKRE